MLSNSPSLPSAVVVTKSADAFRDIKAAAAPSTLSRPLLRSSWELLLFRRWNAASDSQSKSSWKRAWGVVKSRVI